MTHQIRTIRLLILVTLAFAVGVFAATAALADAKKPTGSAAYVYADNGEWIAVATGPHHSGPAAGTKARRYRYDDGEWIAVTPTRLSKSVLRPDNRPGLRGIG